jgi:hypothetical protein
MGFIQPVLGVGYRGFYVPFCRKVFYYAEIAVHKKGGVNDLGKLRNKSKAILTFFFSDGKPGTLSSFCAIVGFSNIIMWCKKTSGY